MERAFGKTPGHSEEVIDRVQSGEILNAVICRRFLKIFTFFGEIGADG